MKHWKRGILSGLIAFLGILLLFVGAPTLAAPTKDSNSQSDNPYDLVPSRRVGNMRVSLETGQPLVLYMVNYPVKADSPEAMARQYLQENASLLHLNDSKLADLQHRHTRESLSGYTVRFDQYVAGIPVYKGNIAVHINQQNVVTYVANDYKPTANLARKQAAISSAQARNTAHSTIGIKGNLRLNQAELVVYQEDILAYHIRVIADSPIGDWEAFVDAGSGELLSYENIAYDFGDDKHPSHLVDGTGLIWDPDPLTSATATYGDTGFTDNNDANSSQLAGEQISVTLRDIEFSGGQYTLRGPYAVIVDSENPSNGLFSQASSTFNFNRNQDGFEAVQTYYHIDDSMRYLNVTLGLSIMPFQYSGGARFDPHGLNGADNSHYLGGSGEVAFGEGGVDDAEDSDVIHHELGHGLHDWVTNGNLSQVNGLSEGSGDYWAQSYNRSVDSWTPTDPAYHYVFRWDGHNEFWNGRVTNYSAVYPGGLVGQIHTDGQIWATCMMKVYDAIGKTKSDTIFWEGLGMTNSSTNQEDAAIAVYQAAVDLGYSFADRQAIRNVFGTCVYNIPPDPTPYFTLSATPPSVSVCAGNSAIYTVTATAINSFSDPVTLTTANQPVGSTVAFATNPIVPTASTVMTVSNLTVAGTHTIDITGTFGITTAHTTLDLNVSSGTPSAPTLTTPANGATGVSSVPAFTWATVAGASSYDIEIATDAGFTAIVDSANVATNSYSGATLNNETTYYWRVRAVSGCGSSSWSTVFGFTTQAGSLVCNGSAVDFESGIPTDWSVVDNTGGAGIVWGTTTDSTCGITNLTNGSGEAACADSDDAGSGAPAYDTELVSNPLDFTGFDTATLDVAAYYRDLNTNNNDQFEVDYFDGTAWNNLVSWDEDHEPEDISVSLPLTAQNVRFRYFGDGWDWYAQVDDVALSCSCSAPSPPANVTITEAMNGTDTDLSWTDTGDSSYEVWWIVNDPYFMPGDGGSSSATVGTASYTHAGSIGNSANNYFYVVTNSCGTPTGSFDRVGEFDFDIVAGAP